MSSSALPLISPEFTEQISRLSTKQKLGLFHHLGLKEDFEKYGTFEIQKNGTVKIFATDGNSKKVCYLWFSEDGNPRVLTRRHDEHKLDTEFGADLEENNFGSEGSYAFRSRENSYIEFDRNGHGDEIAVNVDLGSFEGSLNTDGIGASIKPIDGGVNIRHHSGPELGLDDNGELTSTETIIGGKVGWGVGAEVKIKPDEISFEAKPGFGVGINYKKEDQTETLQGLKDEFTTEELKSLKKDALKNTINDAKTDQEVLDSIGQEELLNKMNREDRGEALDGMLSDLEGKGLKTNKMRDEYVTQPQTKETSYKESSQQNMDSLSDILNQVEQNIQKLKANIS